MTRRLLHLLTVGLMALAATLLAGAASAQNISVTAATPNTGQQGTVSLLVKISGKNFAPGARTDFFLSGTTNPDGIVVHGTQWVSATEVDATVDIADAASLALFDIKVTNTSGRSGKGSDMFQVIRKSAGCVIPPTDPSHFQLLGVFNSATGGTPKFANNLGLSLAQGEATSALSGGGTSQFLVLFSGTSGPGTVEIFFVDPNTGGLLDGTSLGAGMPIQPHITVALPYASTSFTPWVPSLSVADLNGDGVPDAVAADNSNILVAGLLSHIDESGVISYAATAFPLPPTAAFSFGQAIAIGDLDGNPGSEIVVVQKDQSSKSSSNPARIYIYRLAPSGTSFVLVSTLTPNLVQGDNFGNTIAIGDVTGDGRPDIVGGAPLRDVGRATDAGAVLVFPGGGAAPPYQVSPTPILLTLATPLKDDRIGSRVFVGNSDSNPSGNLNVLSLSGTQVLTSPTAPSIRGVVFREPVSASTKETPGDTFSATSAAQGNGWGSSHATLVADVDQDGVEDLVIGTPGADVTSSCPMTGTVYVYTGQLGTSGQFAGWQRRQIFQPPDDASAGDFGIAVSAAAPWHLLFVGDSQRAVGGVQFAGQIYVYRVY